MKSLILSAAGVMALASPALAQEPAAGSFGVTYSNAAFDAGGFEAESDSFALDGVVAMPAFGAWTVTVSGATGQTDDGFEEDMAFAGAAHLTTLARPDLRVGAFVGASNFADETAWTAGAEAQKYLGRATLTGVVAYTMADDSDVDAWSVGADAAFYATRNLRLNAGLGYTILDAGGVEVDGFTYGAGGEYQIARSPLSVTAQYSRAEVEDVQVDTWSVGLRFSFGVGLQARDRAGAALPGSAVIGVLGAL